MDVVLYFLLLVFFGMTRMSATKDVADEVGIVEVGGTTTASLELPIASNLELQKDPEAFTLILVELGLTNAYSTYNN